MSEPKWTSDDTFKFIELYRNEPAIWNPKNKYHKDKNAVNEAWTRISDAMSIPVKEIKKKKETLLAAFRLNHKKVQDSLKSGAGKDDVFKPIWAYYDVLAAFMSGIYQRRCVLAMDDEIVDHFQPNNGISTTMYCLMFLVPLLIFTQIKNLKYLAPFSGFANILLVLTFLICIYYVLQEFPSFDSQPMSVEIGRLPLFIGTVIFAMEGIGVVLPVENTMAKPQHFLQCPGVLNITMTIVVLLYMVMGILGYLRYGEAAEGSITLNLPTEEIPALIAKVAIIFAIFFTYTLQFYVPMEIVWRNIRQRISQPHHNLAQGIMRAVFATLTVAAAALLPELEQVIGLEGAFFYSFLGLIAPSILDLLFRWDRDLGKYNYYLIKDIVLALFGSFVLVTGVMQSIREITRTM